MRRLLTVVIGVSAVQSAGAADAKAELERLFADERAFTWREDPLSATNDGVHDFDDRLPRVTPADQARRLETDRGFIGRLRGIDRGALTAFDAVSYDLFDFMVSQRIALARYREWRAPLNSDSGFYADLLQLHDLQAPRTTRDYENYIARLADVPRYFRENIANMRQGIADGFMLPAEIIPGIASVIAGAQYAKAEDSPFWMPFTEFPAGVPEADRARLAAAGKAAIEGQVIPSFAEFKAFFDDEYGPAARKSIGGDGPAGRPGVLRGPRALFHDAARCDGGGDPRDRACGGRAHPRRDGGDRQRGRLPGQLRRISSCSCAPTRSSTRRRRNSCSGTPRGSRARSTAACRNSSASFRARRTP